MVPTILIPNYLTASLGGTIDPGDVFLWQQDIHEAKKRITLLIENKKLAYALVLGQCLMELDSKIKGLDGYVQANANQDVVQLLAIIRAVNSTTTSNVLTHSKTRSTEYQHSTSLTTRGPRSTCSISRHWWALQRCTLVCTGMSRY